MSISFSGNMSMGGAISALGQQPTVTATMVATGGTITTSGNYKIHTFTSSGTFSITSIPSGANTNLEYLVVGGGGGSPNVAYAGGGGGGGLLTNVNDNNFNYYTTLPDVLTFTSGNQGINITQCVYGNNTWVIFRNAGQVFTSTDAINWTNQGTKIPTFGSFSGAAYGNGKFVALAGASSTSANSFVSTDGITWSLVNSAFTTGAPQTWVNGLNAVTYQNGYFYMYDTGVPIHKRSVDGVTWANLAMPYSAYGDFKWDTRASVLLWCVGRDVYHSTDNGSTWNGSKIFTGLDGGTLEITNTHYVVFPTTPGLPTCYYTTDLITNSSFSMSTSNSSSNGFFNVFAPKQNTSPSVSNLTRNSLLQGGSWVASNVAYMCSNFGSVHKFNTANNTLVFDSVVGVGYGARRIAGNNTIQMFIYDGASSLGSIYYTKVNPWANVVVLSGVSSNVLTAVVNGYSVVVGSGGSNSSSGTNSSFGSIQVAGGGLGGGGGGAANGYAGGSGGGSSTLGAASSGGFGNNIPGQGTLGIYSSYNSKTSSDNQGSGGGAGASGYITNDSPGLPSNITGTTVWYGGGGGGGDVNQTNLIARSYGGQAGWSNNSFSWSGETASSSNATHSFYAARINSGGGAFGMAQTASSSTGGTGVVIIRYPIS